MKIEKLSNSTYRIRKMYKGKTYTVITDYKPTQKEAITLMAKKLEQNYTSSGSMTFKDAAEEYIHIKENVLSPSTIAGYRSIQKRISEDLNNTRLSDITTPVIQKYINNYAVNRSAKTVSNVYGFISSVLATFIPNANISATLPQKRVNEPHIPSDEDIKRIFREASGTKYEIGIKLCAIYGMRRSELCALTLDDLIGNEIQITKAMVLDADRKLVVKEVPKTQSSTRVITISQKLADQIRAAGKIYQGTPDALSSALIRIEKKAGVEPFSFHKLRHYFASNAHAMGICEADILAIGGWKTNKVMTTVYRHSKEEERKKSYEKINSRFDELL